MMQPWEYLIGMPHLPGALDRSTGFLDCAGAVAEYLRLTGAPDAAEAFLGALGGEAAPDDWPEVEARGQWREGDVIVTDAGPGDGLHVSVVVAENPIRVLTSTRGAGVRVVNRYAPTCIVGVYRILGAHPRQ